MEDPTARPEVVMELSAKFAELVTRTEENR